MAEGTGGAGRGRGFEQGRPAEQVCPRSGQVGVGTTEPPPGLCGRPGRRSRRRGSAVAAGRSPAESPAGLVPSGPPLASPTHPARPLRPVLPARGPAKEAAGDPRPGPARTRLGRKEGSLTLCSLVCKKLMSSVSLL